jgi:MarR family transcriptional regulator, transcriptional regulator for hemolysin
MSERNASHPAPDAGPAKAAGNVAATAPSVAFTAQESFGLAIGDVSRAWRAKLDVRLRPLGLSQLKWMALLFISRAKDGLNQTELAAMLGIEAPALTRLVKQLEDADWVKRSAMRSDARCKVVRLTTKAKSVIGRIEAEIQQLRAESIFRLSDAEAAAGLAALRKLQGFLAAL